ncbi:MAG: erythromycin esterase family protein [Bacteroidota bacterium]
MKNELILLCVLFPFFLFAQPSSQKEVTAELIDLHEVTGDDENFEGYERLKEKIGEAEIVMLGEQSHGDATTFQTKIKLIKYLHQEMGFEILAFESSLYECDRAWSMMQQGHDAKDAFAKGLNPMWSTLEEFNPLFEYVGQQMVQDPLMIAGFDSQLTGKIGVDYFAKDLTAYIASFADVTPYQKDIEKLQAFINTTRALEKVKKKKATQYMTCAQRLIDLVESNPNSERSSFWRQTLTGLKVFVSDHSLGTDDRDQKMAENLTWLKEKYPGKKIICWGATSHFLYNSSTVQMEEERIRKALGDYYLTHSMMGDYVKEKYGDAVYTIGFIAHEGSFGAFGMSTLAQPKTNSLEYLIGKSPNDNYFLPLQNLSLQNYVSRPLGHQYMTNDIAKVMDAVVFNRYMRKPYTDWDYLLYLVPENNMGPKRLAKMKKALEERKKREKVQ